MVLHLVALGRAAAVPGPGGDLAAQAQARECLVRGPVVFGSLMRIVHRLALVLWSRLDVRRWCRCRGRTCPSTQRKPPTCRPLAIPPSLHAAACQAKTPSDGGNGHVRTMNVPRRLETCDASQRLAPDSASAANPGRLISRPIRVGLVCPRTRAHERRPRARHGRSRFQADEIRQRVPVITGASMRE